MTATAQRLQLAEIGVGVARVSRVGDRETETLADQTARMQAGFAGTLATVYQEEDVSGRRPLSRRPGLLKAIEAIERGEAQVLVVAYFDRLCRSMTVRAEVVARVEAAGGRVFALDVGEISDQTTGQWLSGSMLMLFAEMVSRSVADRTHDPKQRALDRGVPPFPGITPAYERNEDGTLRPSAHAPAIREAYERRARGESLWKIKDWLREQHGLRLDTRALAVVFGSRITRGELHFGKFRPNLNSHEPIVDEATWRAVNDMRTIQGRRAHSDRLLARLNVLMCAHCGSRLVVHTSYRTQGGVKTRHYYYRCGNGHACAERGFISAPLVEDWVRDAVIEASRQLRGRASLDAQENEAKDAFLQADKALQATLAAFTGFEGEEGAAARLHELRAIRDEAKAHLDRLQRATAPNATVTTRGDWDRLTPDARRELITLTFREIRIGKGGAALDRIDPVQRKSLSE